MAITSLIQTTTVARPDRRFWGIAANNRSQLNSLFSIQLIDLEKQEIVRNSNIDPSNGGMAFFSFPTPPQSYEINEPAATIIVPTQDGGKFIESQGSIFKDIRMSGTIGFRPNPASTELIKGLGAATGISLTVPSTLRNLTNDDRGLNPEEITGFDDLIFLRNIFRLYWDRKTNNELARKTVMVWTYTKESEQYVVEPLTFTVTRDRSSPLSWTYNIQLRSLYRFDTSFEVIPDSVNIFQQISNVSQSLRRIGQDISLALTEIAGAVNFVANIPFAITGIFTSGVEILNGILEIKNAGARFATIGQDLPKSLGSQVRQLRSLIEQIKAPLPEDKEKLHSGEGGKFTHSLKKMWTASNMLLALDPLWQAPRQIQVADFSVAYLNEFGEPPFSAGSLLDVRNITIPDSATEEEIIGGEDIRATAKRLLGDAAQWKTLVILNNLKPPYISTQSGDGVLGPGAKILVPKSADAKDEDTTIPRGINTPASQEALSPILKKYGRDIRLRPSSGGNELVDFQVSQSGDLDVIESIPNVEQALFIKFATQQGELTTHPTFGARYPIGTKIKGINKLQEFALNTKITFLQDLRIKEINDLKIFIDGDKIVVSSKLTLQNSNIQLPITFAVRS